MRKSPVDYKYIKYTVVGSIMCGILISSPLFGEAAKSLWKGHANSPKIALTFDDGPKPLYLRPILDILKKHDVQATFFVVAREAERYPRLIKRLISEGHEVGNHTYSHPRLDRIPTKDIEGEIKSASSSISKLTGKKVIYFRPPGGHYNKLISSVVRENQMITVFWSINAGDYTTFTSNPSKNGYITYYSKSEAQIYSDVVQKTVPGSIILFHSTKETIKALPRIIHAFKERGLEMATISTLRQNDIQ
ncbi:MAG: polysaccharide deacetylase family protein [Candidatus Margulisbacteria bacterium]|nr:polysaccharide deacetylase family protein [Candidatus Margulisiibacteriota bacterium]